MKALLKIMKILLKILKPLIKLDLKNGYFDDLLAQLFGEEASNLFA